MFIHHHRYRQLRSNSDICATDILKLYFYRSFHHRTCIDLQAYRNLALPRLQAHLATVFKMGGGPCKENLLVVLPGPKDEAATNEIRKRFPYIDVMYYQVGGMNDDRRETKEKLRGEY